MAHLTTALAADPSGVGGPGGVVSGERAREREGSKDVTIPGCNVQLSPGFAYRLPEGVEALGEWKGLGQLLPEPPAYSPSWGAPLPTTLPGMPTMVSPTPGFWDIVKQQIVGWGTTGQQVVLAKAAEGTYIQRGPRGEIIYRQIPGEPPLLRAAAGTITGEAPPAIGMILLAGGAFLVVFMMVKGRK